MLTDEERRVKQVEATRKWRAKNRDAINNKRNAERRAAANPDSLKPSPTCEICGGISIRKGKQISLTLDHCHRTGRARGWLCAACNLVVGALHDSPDLCVSAAAYLRAFEIREQVRRAVN